LDTRLVGLLLEGVRAHYVHVQASNCL